MKSKLPLRHSAAVLLLLLSVCVALARGGQPPTAPPPPAPPQAAPTIDPSTGLPVVPPPPWKDPNWTDPDKVIANLRYDGLPISEVAQNLREEFKIVQPFTPKDLGSSSDFDIILPEDFGQGQPENANKTDWNATIIHLRLQNVRASEIFNAMNLLFENDRIPLQWELKMNGSRRLALLRVKADPRSDEAYHKPVIKRVYYVGDLCFEDGTRRTMSQLVETVFEVWRTAYPGNDPHLQFHDRAQLLIATGTDEEINFIQQILEALRAGDKTEKVRRQEAAFNKQTAEIKAAKESAKPNDGGGSQ